MENRAYAIATGLFALLLILSISLAFWWLGGPHTEQQEAVVLSSQPVTGLNPEATVKFRGVNVGKVVDIDFDPAKPLDILIKLSIDKRLKLTRGTFAKLKTQGVTGLAYVDIDDTGDNPMPLGDNRILLARSSIDTLVDTGQHFVDQARLLVDDSIRLVGNGNRLLDQQNLDHIEHTLANLEQASKDTAPMLQSMTQSAQRINNALSDDQQRKLASTVESIRSTAEQAGPLVQDMRQAVGDFRALSLELRRGTQETSSTLNNSTLPHIDELTRRLSHDAQHLDSVLDNLEQNPQSLVLGKPHIPPGPGEAGFKP